MSKRRPDVDEEVAEYVQQSMNKLMEQIDLSVENRLNEKLKPREHGTPKLKFSEADKKLILQNIDDAAKHAATRYDDETGKAEFSKWKYDQAIPTPAEFETFLFVCEQKALDPRANQIYFQKRGGRATYIVAIDSYRLMAERSGTYRASDDITQYFDAQHKPYYGPGPDHCVVACWKKDTADGEWYKLSQIGFFNEYKQTYGKGQNAKPTAMWEKMGRSQLEKCTEAKLLRKGWPAELGGVYTKEEMEQATNDTAFAPEDPNKGSTVAQDLDNLRKGAPNKGHGQEGMKKDEPKPKGDGKPKPEEKKADAGKKTEVPADPMDAICENCIDGHTRKQHDGETGNGACMVDNCRCDGFVDVPAAAACEKVRINTAEEGKPEKWVDMTKCWGKVIESTAPGPAKTAFASVRVYGLPNDLFKDPNDFFVCRHHSLWPAVDMMLGEKCVFLFETRIDKGEKKPENKGKVWQQIEDVLFIGSRQFVGGKPVAPPDEQAQEPSPDDTAQEPAPEDPVVPQETTMSGTEATAAVYGPPQPATPAKTGGVEGVFDDGKAKPRKKK
jgi:phage recombination protein Bet